MGVEERFFVYKTFLMPKVGKVLQHSNQEDRLGLVLNISKEKMKVQCNSRLWWALRCQHCLEICYSFWGWNPFYIESNSFKQLLQMNAMLRSHQLRIFSNLQLAAVFIKTNFESVHTFFIPLLFNLLWRMLQCC